MFRTFVLAGSLNALLAVALGAFGAHALKESLDPHYLSVYETGVHYHMIHALGLILVGLVAERVNQTSLVNWAGRLLIIGIILFSGSLYILSLTQLSYLGMITPLGGVSFIVGWFLLGAAAFKKRT